MKQHTVDIQLLGQKIALKTAGEPDVIREVVELVARRLKSAEPRAGKTSAPHHVALLALLDLAEEYVQAKRRVAAFQGEVGERSRELAGLIEAEFK